MAKTKSPPTITTAPGGAPPAPPVEKRVRITVWILPSIHKAMQHECVDRELSIGELIEESLQQRMVPIWKKGNDR